MDEEQQNTFDSPENTPDRLAQEMSIGELAPPATESQVEDARLKSSPEADVDERGGLHSDGPASARG